MKTSSDKPITKKDLFLLNKFFKRFKEIKGFYIGKTCLFDGHKIKERAHAHIPSDKGGRCVGWICIRDGQYLWTINNKPSMLLLHEVAHILSDSGHNKKWRETYHKLGGKLYWNDKRGNIGKT